MAADSVCYASVFQPIDAEFGDEGAETILAPEVVRRGRSVRRQRAMWAVGLVSCTIACLAGAVAIAGRTRLASGPNPHLIAKPDDGVVLFTNSDGDNESEQIIGHSLKHRIWLAWKSRHDRWKEWLTMHPIVPIIPTKPLAQAEPKDVCNPKSVIPQPISMPSWELPENTKHLCYLMLQDQVKITGGQPQGRNWCWVVMKRYGCLYNLGERYTWAEAQDATHKAAPVVPDHATNPFDPLQDEHVCDKRVLGEAPEWTDHSLAKAKAWFREHVAVYVLNLQGESDRWHNVSNHLRNLDIEHSRVFGYDMGLKKDISNAYTDDVIPRKFNYTRAQEEARAPNNGMGGIRGTMGCAAGHFRAQRVAWEAEKAKPITVILEDDAYVSHDFVPRLWRLVLEEVPCDWEAVSLASRCPYGKCVSRHLSRVYPDEAEPAWRCRHGVNYGFQGMVYRTKDLKALQEKWKPVVFDETRPHCLDIDVALAAISDEVAFYAVPSLQFPGFLTERQDESVRRRINKKEEATYQP